MNSRLENHQEILRKTRLGVWEICFNEEETHHEMYVDDVMYDIMGMKGEYTPEECYMHWYSRINDGYHDYVNMAVESMLQTKDIVQLEYTWNHPDKGEVVVRCLGRQVENRNGLICLQGYHRTISDMKKPRFLPDGTTSEIFEYHEKKKTIYFHTNRSFLAGDARKEENFPECWIETRIVHPHFAEEFKEMFCRVQDREEIRGKEILMMTPKGTYQWVKVRTRHLGLEENDVNTIIVILDPTNQKRTLELEYMRKNDFYHAVLSEAVAYAEVDVESGHLMEAGGLWEPYAIELGNRTGFFEYLIQKNLEVAIRKEDREEYRKFLNLESMKEEFFQGNPTMKFCFRRQIENDWYWMELTVHVFQERYTENMYALLYLKNIDIAKKRELMHEMAAMRDPLTNVYNRRSFEGEVINFIQSEETGIGALILLDLDDFKGINDKYGHLKGDEALKKLTDVLLSTFRRKDVVGRLGGDEFLVFIKGVHNKEILDHRMEQIYAALKEPEDIPISCSAGISFVEKENFSYEKVLKQADEALYRSKQQGKNQHCYYEPEAE